MVDEIALDRATGTIWMLKSKDVINELWTLPLAGGKLERVPGETAYAIYGVAAGSVLVSHGNRVDTSAGWQRSSTITAKRRARTR